VEGFRGPEKPPKMLQLPESHPGQKESMSRPDTVPEEVIKKKQHHVSKDYYDC